MNLTAAPKVVTARSVRSGKTVYLTSCDAWTPDMEIAESLTEDDQGWRLEFAKRLREVVDASLTEFTATALA